jgi:hypothetical protein
VQKIKFPFSHSLAQELRIAQPETNIKYSLRTLPFIFLGVERGKNLKFKWEEL